MSSRTLESCSLGDLFDEIGRRINELEQRVQDLQLESKQKERQLVALRINQIDQLLPGGVNKRRFEEEDEEAFYEEEEEEGLNGEDDDFEDSGEAIDLFSDERIPGGPPVVFERILNKYQFDLVKFVKSLIDTGDSLAMPRTINFIRSRRQQGLTPEKVIADVTGNAGDWQHNDAYLKPILGPDDALLWWGDEFSEEGDGELLSGEEEENDDENEEDIGDLDDDE